MFFDPMYLLMVAPAILLGMWAQWRVHSAYSAASEIVPASGLSGAEAAAVILRHSGVPGVEVDQTDGFLSDHYDPRAKVLRLSPDVYNGRTLAALGIAAHEAGHALQDGERYPLLAMRNGLVPLASVGGNLSWILLILGFVLHSFNLVLVGIAAFSMTVIFQLINLPVEFDASARAKRLLPQLGLITAEEKKPVARVLSAAALTYVAATLMSALQLLYFLMQAGLLGGRRRND
ncbi:MAG TPA: zinc metallopeptidase [Planctomycetota bacterium]|nr:zinc metallopeptidase [Planctomycetota bacterium]